MIRGIHHVALHTADLDAMLAFYVGVIGFVEVARAEWDGVPLIDEVIGVPGSAARQAMLRAGNCYLELFEYSRPAPREAGPARPNVRGYTHLCLDVTDIEAEWERLTAAGVRFTRRPGDFGEVKAVYGRDPEGNVVEIQETMPGCPFPLRVPAG
jgi:catechol 2,3-dioxygenase-like lactoylglutathione lyase family enzyme